MEITIRVLDEERFKKAISAIYLFNENEPFEEQLKAVIVGQLVTTAKQAEESVVIERARSEWDFVPFGIE